MNTLTKTTHIAKVRRHDLTIAEQVQQILGWSHQEYCDHQFEQYEAFAELMFSNHEPLVNVLRHSDLFRGFWNNEWIMRTESEFLPFAEDSDLDVSELTEQYLYIHNAGRLQDDSVFDLIFQNTLKLIIKCQLRK